MIEVHVFIKFEYIRKVVYCSRANYVVMKIKMLNNFTLFQCQNLFEFTLKDKQTHGVA